VLIATICKFLKNGYNQWFYRIPTYSGVLKSKRFRKQVLGKLFMANTAQARKRARQAVKQNAHNSSQRSTLRTAIKAVRKAIEAGDKAAAASVFKSAVSTIDTIADKKIIHKNKAARHKSRLASAIKALA
jgi:small subunit ribosomal protein S20